MISAPQITISVGSSQRGRGNLKPDSGEYHHVGTNPRAGGGTSTPVSRARLVRGPSPRGRGTAVAVSGRPANGRCRDPPSSPTQAAYAVSSRSSPLSRKSPPSETDARPHDPAPSAPLGRGPQEKTCSSSDSSWLHFLRSWSLRQTRGGSHPSTRDRLYWLRLRPDCSATFSP